MPGPNWAQRPSRSASFPRWPLIYPFQGKSVSGWIFNNSLTGTFCHWIKHPSGKWRDFPCFGASECPVCPYPMVWKGWVPVIAGDDHRKSVLQFSENVFVECEEAIEDMEKLRGLFVTINRRGRSRKGECFLESVKTAQESDCPALPEEVDIRPWLLRLWGFRDGVNHKDLPIRWHGPNDDSTPPSNGRE